ncbi:hypothetical protein ACWDSJ_23860 [Nocardia sp. NPDC003482]
MTRTYEYKSDFARRYIAQGRSEGRAEGEAQALLVILDARGIVLSDDSRRRIADCRDMDQLNAWLRRSATATSADELFD